MGRVLERGGTVKWVAHQTITKQDKKACKDKI